MKKTKRFQLKIHHISVCMKLFREWHKFNIKNEALLEHKDLYFQILLQLSETSIKQTQYYWLYVMEKRIMSISYLWQYENISYKGNVVNKLVRGNGNCGTNGDLDLKYLSKDPLQVFKNVAQYWPAIKFQQSDFIYKLALIQLRGVY